MPGMKPTWPGAPAGGSAGPWRRCLRRRRSRRAPCRGSSTLKTELKTWRTRSLAGLDVLGLYLDALALRGPECREGRECLRSSDIVAVLTDGQKQLLALELSPAGRPSRDPSSSHSSFVEFLTSS